MTELDRGSPSTKRATCTQNSPQHIALIRAGQRRTHARRKLGEGFIYLAEMTGTDAVKIGHSLNPAKRVRSVTLNGGSRGKLLAQTPGTITQERALHKALRSQCRIDLPGFEFYPRSILNHPAIPAGLRVGA